MRLQFCIYPIIIGLVDYRVTYFHNKGLDVLALHVTKCAFVEVSIMSIEESYLTFDSGRASYSEELCHGFKPPFSIHITVLCAAEYPVQWVIGVEIFGVLL